MIVEQDVNAVAAAVVQALKTTPTPIPVNVEQMNGSQVLGSGTEADKWRGAGV